jgi:hypothetical protein
MFQYYSADTVIFEGAGRPSQAIGNQITLATGKNLTSSPLSAFPIRTNEKDELIVRDGDGLNRIFKAEDGLAAMFLRPLGNLENPGLELVIWADTKENLKQVARLLPLLTGAGQPDFVVLRRDALWRGLDGAVALGFLDAFWNVTKSSFFV